MVRHSVYVSTHIIDSSSVVRDFGFTLQEVNWLGNVINCVFLPTAFLTPIITKRYGVRRSVCHMPRERGASSHHLASCFLDSVTLPPYYSCYRHGSVTPEL